MPDEFETGGDGQPLPPVISDRINIATALDMADKSKPARMACCPNCQEPMVSTMKYRGAEFVCQMCGLLCGWLDPIPKANTPELEARQKELQALFDSGKEPGAIEGAEVPQGD